LKDGETLSSLGLAKGGKLYFRDLGPQVGWTTVSFCHGVFINNFEFTFRVTTCLENLEMSGNLKHVREMSWILSGKCRGKISQNCSLLVEYLRSYGYLVASS